MYDYEYVVPVGRLNSMCCAPQRQQGLSYSCSTVLLGCACTPPPALCYLAGQAHCMEEECHHKPSWPRRRRARCGHKVRPRNRKFGSILHHDPDAAIAGIAGSSHLSTIEDGGATQLQHDVKLGALVVICLSLA